MAVDRLDLAHAVVFLHRRGQLVFADAVAGVIGERGDAGEARLRAVAPGQPVDVIARYCVAHQHAGVDHALEVIGRLGVDRVIVGADRRIEIDFGLGDMQKAPRLALGVLARFRAGEHVVGWRQNFGGALGHGTQGAKRLNERQFFLREASVRLRRAIKIATKAVG
jgi:hypothetical protein